MKYGEFIVSVEIPEILDLLKLRWTVIGRRLNPNYNFKVMRFTSTLAETIINVSEKLRIKTLRVYPRGTTSSEEHAIVMKRCGLDKHMASAYLVAVKGLNQNHKNI